MEQVFERETLALARRAQIFGRASDFCGAICFAVAFPITIATIVYATVGNPSGFSVVVQLVVEQVVLIVSLFLLYLLGKKRFDAREEWMWRVSFNDPRAPFVISRSCTDPIMTLEPAAYVGPSQPGTVGAGFTGRSRLISLGEGIDPVARLLAVGLNARSGALQIPLRSAMQRFTEARLGVSYTALVHTLFLTTSDADWWQVFESLAAGARAIIVIPGSTAALTRETTYLRRTGLLAKTLVYMPPITRHDGRTRKFDVNTSWEDTRTEWRSRGFNLPAYTADGMLYLPAEDWSVVLGHSLGGVSESTAAREAITELAPVLAGDTRSLESLMVENVPRLMLPPRLAGLSVHLGPRFPARSAHATADGFDEDLDDLRERNEAEDTVLRIGRAIAAVKVSFLAPESFDLARRRRTLIDAYKLLAEAHTSRGYLERALTAYSEAQKYLRVWISRSPAPADLCALLGEIDTSALAVNREI